MILYYNYITAAHLDYIFLKQISIRGDYAHRAHSTLDAES